MGNQVQIPENAASLEDGTMVKRYEVKIVQNLPRIFTTTVWGRSPEEAELKAVVQARITAFLGNWKLDFDQIDHDTKLKSRLPRTGTVQSVEEVK